MTVLWVPAGFIVVEKVLNQAEVLGVRWMCLPDITKEQKGQLEPWAELVKLTDPGAGREKRKSTQVAMVALQATQKSVE